MGVRAPGGYVLGLEPQEGGVDYDVSLPVHVVVPHYQY